MRHDEWVGLRQDYRRGKYGDDMRDEGCPGVEEDAEHYRQHAIGHQINAGPHVRHDGIGDDGEDEEEGHHEQYGAKAVEIVASELLEIQQKQDDQNGGKDDSTSEARQTFLGRQGVFLLMLFP